jgi:FixJ family two-component response regulator
MCPSPAVTEQAGLSSTGAAMTEKHPIVFLIDDDPSVRDALDGLLRSVGLQVQSFGSAQAFLRAEPPDGPACLVLDVRLPGPSGLDFQRDLAESNNPLPIIFITGHHSCPVR